MHDSGDLWQYTSPNLMAYITLTVRAVKIVGEDESTDVVVDSMMGFIKPYICMS